MWHSKQGQYSRQLVHLQLYIQINYKSNSEIFRLIGDDCHAGLGWEGVSGCLGKCGVSCVCAGSRRKIGDIHAVHCLSSALKLSYADSVMHSSIPFHA